MEMLAQANKSGRQRQNHQRRSKLSTLAQIAGALQANHGRHLVRNHNNKTGHRKGPAHSRATRRREKLYLDLVAEHGREAFLAANSDDSATDSPRRPSLPITPSMTMLSEAVLALKESPSALTKMDVSSTGGVYQVRRKSQSQWDENSLDSSPASRGSTRSLSTCNLPSQSREEIGMPQNQLTSLSKGKAISSKLLKSNSIMQGPCRSISIKEPRQSRRLLLDRGGSLRSGSAPPRQRTERQVSKLAVFKPEDEETGAKTSARLGAPNPARAGMVVGGGARRERAAYVLDKSYGGFSGVPPTVLAQVPSTDGKGKIVNIDEPNGEHHQIRVKRGSLQRFCASDGSADERPDLVAKAPPIEVFKIGILDLRIFNTDRHAGNILCKVVKPNEEATIYGTLHQSEDGVQSNSTVPCVSTREEDWVSLIPIDHALSLPDWRFLGEAYFDWHFWPQAKVRFDEKTIEHVRALDPEKDASELRKLKIQASSIVTNTIATIVIKRGIEFGCTLHDFGSMFQRPYPPGHPDHNLFFSPLEHLVMEACSECGHDYHPAGTSPPPPSLTITSPVPTPESHTIVNDEDREEEDYDGDTDSGTESASTCSKPGENETEANPILEKEEIQSRASVRSISVSTPTSNGSRDPGNLHVAVSPHTLSESDLRSPVFSSATSAETAFAYGASHPPDGFYDSLAVVLDKHLADHSWKQWLE